MRIQPDGMLPSPRRVIERLQAHLLKARLLRRAPLVDEPVRAGVIGCGMVSDRYLETASLLQPIEVVACADRDPDAARRRATAHGIPTTCTVPELLADPSIELVINLTPPAAHYEISAAALAAGKSVYSEKPLAVEREDARALLARSEAADLRLGCAPDSVLGGGLQTCRKLLDEGAIGTPFAAVAHCATDGAEIWHPDADRFYQPGSGPFEDMAPYYLTALVHLLGPVRCVRSMAATSPLKRVIARGPQAGREIAVNVPTLVMALLEFANGVVCSLIVTVDFAGAGPSGIQVHGTEGTLDIPDPNTFGGPVRLFCRKQRAWRTIPLTHGYVSNYRGLGAAELALAMRTGRPHRTDGRTACHVVDVMQAILEVGRSGSSRTIESRCEPPAPMPPGLWPGML